MSDRRWLKHRLEEESRQGCHRDLHLSRLWQQPDLEPSKSQPLWRENDLAGAVRVDSNVTTPHPADRYVDVMVPPASRWTQVCVVDAVLSIANVDIFKEIAAIREQDHVTDAPGVVHEQAVTHLRRLLRR